jgi:CubicO group peptidase (beta-lactamase class C family)
VHLRSSAVVLSFALPLWAIPAHRAAAQTRIDTAVVERAAAEFLAATKTPGAAIAIVADGRVAYAKGFGVTRLGGTEAITASTMFQVGSTTKVVTAALLATLAERGTLRLDAPIGRYVASLPAYLAGITAGQLLAQTSGLRDIPGDSGSRDPGALAAFVRSWQPDIALVAPGTVFSYSNAGYALAGLVAQRAGGAPYAQLVRDRVFAPLGMAHATFDIAAAARRPHALGHVGPPNAAPAALGHLVDDTRLWPAGCMNVGVDELARFVVALMDSGRIDGHQVLPAAAVTAMAAAHADVPHPFEDTRYGYGLFIDRFRGERSLWHPGSMPGAGSIIRILPERRVGVVVAANREVRLDTLVAAALQAALPDLPRGAPPSARPKTVLATTAAERAAIVGTYENRWPVEILSRGDLLFVKQFGREAPLFRVDSTDYSTAPARGLRSDELRIVPPRDGRPGYLHTLLWVFGRK